MSDFWNDPVTGLTVTVTVIIMAMLCLAFLMGCDTFVGSGNEPNLQCGYDDSLGVEVCRLDSLSR